MGQECSKEEETHPAAAGSAARLLPEQKSFLQETTEKKTSNNVIQEAAECLIDNFYDRKYVERVREDILKAVQLLPGDAPVNEVIEKYFRGRVHLNAQKSLAGFKPRLLTAFDNRDLTLHVDAFPHHLIDTEWEKSYTTEIQRAINYQETIRYIDLTAMTGGDLDVPQRALEKSRLDDRASGSIKISPQTGWAGEQLAAWLVGEKGWTLQEPRVHALYYSGALQPAPIGNNFGMILYLETFPVRRVNTVFEKILIEQIREIFEDRSIAGIDLTQVTGGDFNVLYRALSSAILPTSGTVFVNKNTLAAGEKLASWLHYDRKWNLVGNETGDQLGNAREFQLADGSLLSFRVDNTFYQTPGGFRLQDYQLNPVTRSLKL